jgi:ribose/xylose/arabinose/galactoside ABC-type transport system permease subunit
MSGDRANPAGATVHLRALLGRLKEGRAVWPLLALALILIVDGFITPGFFAIRIVEGHLFGSFIDVLYRSMPTAVVALGMAVVIGTKGIDLSVGAVIAICGATIAWRLHMGDPPLVVLGVALAATMLCGLWNGLLVAILDIQPIVATLILMVSGRGIAQMINLLYGGTDPSFTSDFFAAISTGHLAMLPSRLFVGVGIFALAWVLMRRTAFGLFVEAVGGNAAAADLAGIDARMVKLAAYLVSGLCAGLAGVVITADTHTSDPVSAGLYIELDAILAVVIGGGSLAGGRVYLGLTVLGALIIQSLTTSILMSGVPPEYNLVVKAVVVLIVLLLQSGKIRTLLSRAVSLPGAGSP